MLAHLFYRFKTKKVEEALNKLAGAGRLHLKLHQHHRCVAALCRELERPYSLNYLKVKRILLLELMPPQTPRLRRLALARVIMV